MLLAVPSSFLSQPLLLGVNIAGANPSPDHANYRVEEKTGKKKKTPSSSRSFGS